jgi:hypothetical protein
VKEWLNDLELPYRVVHPFTPGTFRQMSISLTVKKPPEG